MQLEDYTTGTVSILNSSTELTGTGTAWETIGFKAGDTFHAQGLVGIIASVDGDTAITLRDTWAGTTIANGTYLLRYQPDNSRVQGTTRQLLDTLRNGFSLVGKSMTSLAIATGSKTFDVGAGNLGWGVGARLRASSDADGTNFMEGVVTSYADGGLTLNVDLTGGAGTHADWTINLVGQPGVASDIAADTHAAASKATPVDADEFPLVDSAASFGLKKLTWASLKAFLNTLYLSTTLARREVLTANRTYYVATTGSDSNDGLTSGTAFLTIQKAVNVVLGLDLSTYNVTIQVADGTYTGSTSVNAPFVGSGTVTIRGNPTTPANCVINPAAGGFYGSNGARFSLSGFKVTPGSAAIQADGIGTIITLTGSMEYGAAGTNHLAVTSGGTITVLANYTISGSAQVHWNADGLSVINCLGRTITLTGTPAFGPCFALAGQIALIRCYSCTFTGAATGNRYNVQYNSVIHTNGGGASYLPGDAIGTAANGGLYR